MDLVSFLIVVVMEDKAADPRLGVQQATDCVELGHKVAIGEHFSVMMDLRDIEGRRGDDMLYDAEAVTNILSLIENVVIRFQDFRSWSLHREPA